MTQNNFIYIATDGKRNQIEPIDCLDESGTVALKEWKKRKRIREAVSRDLNKVSELKSKDWIKILLYANKNTILKTPLMKELFILGERIGINDIGIWEWKAYKYGPLSRDIEESIEHLKKDKEISEVIGSSSKYRSNIYEYRLEDKEGTKKLWERLPNSIKSTIKEIIFEFRQKNTEEIKQYVYAAYPEYAINAQQ